MDKNLISRATRNQLLDYYLIPELTKNLPFGYARRVRGKLSSHNIIINSNTTIYQTAKLVIEGKKILLPAASVDNSPSTREGKDMSYAGFWSLVDILLAEPFDRSYVGLAANQIDSVRDKVSGWNDIVVCENNRKKARELRGLASFITKVHLGPRIKIICSDIFRHLNTKESHTKYNIFDLDLMCTMPSLPIIDSWAKTIHQSSSPGINLIYIAACIGRSITEEEHSFRAEYFRRALENTGFELKGNSPLAYRDRQIPMRVDRIVLERK